MGIKMLLQVAENGISYCGTLCASIMMGMVLVFLLQLLVWTYIWVIHPTMIHSRALWRYCQGTGTWSDVTRLQGHRPFIPTWKGPGTGTPWTAQYVQREVRGRGPNQRPFDLLVADGVAVARLRHGTIRGRTNRFSLPMRRGQGIISPVFPPSHQDGQLCGSSMRAGSMYRS